MAKNGKDVEFDIAMYVENLSKASWYYELLTDDEIKRFKNVLNMKQDCIKGSDCMKWDIMNAMYGAFIQGIGIDELERRKNMNSEVA